MGYAKDARKRANEEEQRIRAEQEMRAVAKATRRKILKIMFLLITVVIWIVFIVGASNNNDSIWWCVPVSVLTLSIACSYAGVNVEFGSNSLVREEKIANKAPVTVAGFVVDKHTSQCELNSMRLRLEDAGYTNNQIAGLAVGAAMSNCTNRKMSQGELNNLRLRLEDAGIGERPNG